MLGRFSLHLGEAGQLSIALRLDRGKLPARLITICGSLLRCRRHRLRVLARYQASQFREDIGNGEADTAGAEIWDREHGIKLL
ncbi:hypothetical protein ASF53_19530 [Methylobacterium sp. Leaf123]|nr:hypothetical protein ASF53_19530 [Methylobacterium sp. Leaf123]